MRAVLFLAGIVSLVGAFCAFDARTHVLSASECRAVTGTVNNLRCWHAGTCEAYNHNQGAPNCNSGQGTWCYQCSVTSGRQWETCQVYTGANCVGADGDNDCGQVGLGYCNGFVCENVQWHGEPDCLDAPNCQA